MYNKLIRSHEWLYMLPARQHYVGYIPVRRGFTYGQHCGVIWHIILRYMRCAVLFGFYSIAPCPSLRERRWSAYIKPHNPTSKIHRHLVSCRHYTFHRCDDKHCVERRIAVLFVISTTRSAAAARQCAHCPACSSPKAG